MEDPLFEPWSPPGDGEAPEPRRVPTGEEPSPRWRSRMPAPRIPRARPAPQPLRDPKAADAATEPVDVTTPASDGARILRELVLPRLRSCAQRLEAERHGTSIDDRSGGQPPAVRFQVRPRRGPFDTGRPVSRPTLEIVYGEQDHGQGLSALVWLDPDALSPTERLVVPPDQWSLARLDSLVLDFLGRALAL